VLVLPFEDQSADAALASFGVLAADFVTEAIAATPFAEAVPAITALALVRDGTVAPPGVDRLVHLARPVGAAWVIAGTYVVQGDSLLVRAALTSGRDGQVVRTLRSVASLRSTPGVALSALARSAVVATALELDPRVRTDAMLPTIPPRWESYEAYARGKDHFLARRYDEAIEAFDEAYARDSSFRFPLFYQGMVYVNTGNWDRLEEVVREYRRRQTARSEPMERLVLRILEAFLVGDFPAIYRVHREAEALGMIGPGGLGHFSMGAVALDVGRPREAIEIVRQSDPDRGELKGWSSYYDVLARAYMWLGELDAALDAARRLQADHPGLDLGPRRAMEALARAGRVAAVDSVLELTLNSMPETGALLRFAGNVLRVTGHETDALRQYARAVAHEREAQRDAVGRAAVNLRAALGEGLLLAGELDEAEGIFRAMTVERPELMDPITSLGRIAARRGDSAEVARIDRLLTERATQPHNRGGATYRRARLAALRGDGERAARLLEQAWREGYSIYYVLWTDPEFAGVRDHPAMRALLAPKG
jgi:tetratricopeptide (TPR) repeat protein